jgi:hypothetical protein
VVALAVDVPLGGAGVQRCAADGSACRSLERGERFAAPARVGTGPGARAVLELDGARLELAASTTAVLDTGPVRRVGLLEGEATLQREAHDIGGGSPTARAVGLRVGARLLRMVDTAPTTLSVRAGKDEAMLTVRHGEVRVTGIDAGEGDATAVLRSGESARLVEGTEPDRAAAWSGEAAPVDGPSLPASESAGPPRGLGTMTARVPGTTEVIEGVRLVSHRVHVVVRDGFARTEVEEEFQNDTARTLEGRYVFPLPARASISRLALWVGKELVEGEMLPRARAAAIFRGIVEDTVRPRDPALLEWVSGAEFSLKIFPIPPRSSRKVVLAYNEALAARGGRLRYVYPLSAGSDRGVQVDDFSVDVLLAGEARGAQARTTGYAAMHAETQEGTSITYAARSFVPRGDLEIDFPEPVADGARVTTFVPSAPEPGARAAAGAANGGNDDAGREPGYFAARLVAALPPGDAAPAYERRDRAVVLDVSQSQSAETVAAQAAVAVTLVRRLDAGERFVILACDSACSSYPEDGLALADPATVAAAASWVGGLKAGGSSDIAGALLLAVQRLTVTGAGARPDGSGSAQVVYLGDGAPSSGELDATSIAARVRPALQARQADLRLLGAGRTVDEVTLRALAAELGATYEAVRSGGSLVARAEELALALRSPVLRSPKVELPPGLEDVQPRVLPNLRLGEEVQLVGRLRPGADLSGALRLTGDLGGRPYQRTAALRWSQATTPNPLLPRVWAEARIADLGASAGPDAVAEVVALSTRYHVMSRHTSLLVLENERMFAEFGIQRTARRAEERADHAFGAMASSGRLGGSHRREGEAGDFGAGPSKMSSGEPEARIGELSGASMPQGAPGGARGQMWGDERADRSGGLGLSGKGEGAGGKGEGIGLGSVGSLGHGAGTSSEGTGFGGGSGGLRPGAPGHTPKAPQVRMGATSVSGRIPPEVIQRIVRQHFGRLRGCYERSLKPGFANAAGRVTVRFVIGRDGAVRNASEAGSDLGSEVTACVVRVFQGMVFPAPDGNIVTVVYPITFTPGDGPPGTPPEPPRASPLRATTRAQGEPSIVDWRVLPQEPWTAPPPQRPTASHQPGDERWRSEGEDALAKLRARRAEQPEVRAAHAALVRGLLARGRFAEALAAAGRFGEVDPDSAAARELLAQAAAAAGDPATALAAVDAHVETEPRSRAAHLRAARALEAARDERRACAHRRALADIERAAVPTGASDAARIEPLGRSAAALADALRCRARLAEPREALAQLAAAALDALPAAVQAHAGGRALRAVQDAFARGTDPEVADRAGAGGQLEVVVACDGGPEGCPQALVVTPDGRVVSPWTPAAARSSDVAVAVSGLTSGVYRTVLVGGRTAARGQVTVRVFGATRKLDFTRAGDAQTVAATHVVIPAW